MLAIVFAALMYFTPVTPVIYEQINNTYTVNYENPGEIFLVTVYKNGAIVGVYFDEDIEYTINNADEVEQIFFNVQIGSEFWKIRPIIIPLSINFLPIVLVIY